MQARELYSVQYDSSWPPESIAHSYEASSGARGAPANAVFLPLRAYALTLLPIGFALRSVQTHISKQIRIEMCVCTLLKPMGRRASKAKKTLPETRPQSRGS